MGEGGCLEKVKTGNNEAADRPLVFRGSVCAFSLSSHKFWGGGGCIRWSVEYIICISHTMALVQEC